MFSMLNIKQLDNYKYQKNTEVNSFYDNLICKKQSSEMKLTRRYCN